MVAKLVQINFQNEVLAEFKLQKRETLLGRTTGDLVFKDNHFMSGTHARIVGQGGRYVLQDLHSRNGIYRRIPATIELKDRDEFLVGEQMFRAEVKNEVEAPAVQAGVDPFADMRRGEDQALAAKGFKHDWEMSREDPEFQAAHAPNLAAAKLKYGSKANPCPKCGKLPDHLEWFYYASLPSSWKALAGRAGWMTLCPQCNVQIDFFVELMN